MQWGIQTHCGMSAQELVVFIDQKYSEKLLKVIIFKGDLHIKRETSWQQTLGWDKAVLEQDI